MNLCRKLSVLSCLVAASSTWTASSAWAAEDKQAWNNWAQSQTREDSDEVVQNREIPKANHFQLVAPLAGMSLRNDLYNIYVLTFAGRYHFSEQHAWEFLRFNLSYPSPSRMNTDIQDKTSYHPDVQLSKVQLSSSYVFTPIYGKYAWNGSHLVHFDMYGSLGGGVRFATDQQPFLQAGLGMNHFLFSRTVAVVPEFQLRGYMENRSDSTLVLESIFQIGTSWLF